MNAGFLRLPGDRGKTNNDRSFPGIPAIAVPFTLTPKSHSW
jgi:hypothetical protein